MVAPSNPGAPLPHPSNKRWWNVVAPQGMVPLYALILSDSFHGVWTHWLINPATKRGMTLPCDNTDQCELCKPPQRRPNRWTGFVAAYSRSHNADKVVALSEGAARQLLPVLERRGTLRGCVVELRRWKPHENAPVHVKVLEERDPKKCQPAFDVYDSLSRLWGVNMDFYKRTAHPHQPHPGQEHDDDGMSNLIPA